MYKWIALLHVEKTDLHTTLIEKQMNPFTSVCFKASPNIFFYVSTIPV